MPSSRAPAGCRPRAPGRPPRRARPEGPGRPAALGEDHHVRAGGGDVLHQMGGDEHARVRTQLLQQLAEAQPLRRVQADRRLVEEQDRRVVDDGLGDADPAHHAARQGLHPLVGAVRQTHPLHGALHGGGDVRFGYLLQPRHVLDELAHREALVVAELLRQIADPAAYGTVLAHAAHGLAEQFQAALRGAQYGGQRPDEGGLASPVRAEESVDADAQRQVEAVDGHPFPADPDLQPRCLDLPGIGRRCDVGRAHGGRHVVFLSHVLSDGHR